MTRKSSRKPARRREPTPKQEGQQILEAAAKAGTDYAHEQVGSPHFSDWVSDQIAEVEEMRKRDPSSVIPLETPADARKVARNMLQQLEWDTKRQLDSREILEMSGATGVFGAGSDDWVRDTYGITRQDVTSAFFDAFDEQLKSESTRQWLTDEVLTRSEEIRGVPASKARRQPAAREARPQAGMTPEQRVAVVAALRHYGADLTDDDHIVKGEKVLGVRIEVRKGRMRMVTDAGQLLASYPAANIGTGVADFVEKFWYWKPVAGTSEVQSVRWSARRRPPAPDDYNRSAHAYDIEVVYPDERFARKHESQIGHIIGQPLVSQGAMLDGYRMEYGPIDRNDYRRLEGLIYTKLGNAVRVRLVQVMYGASRSRGEVDPQTWAESKRRMTSTRLPLRRR